MAHLEGIPGDKSRLVRRYVLVSIGFQVALSLAILALSILSDSTVRLASSYSMLAVEKRLAFQTIGLTSQSLMEEVGSDEPNARLVERLQQKLAQQTRSLQEITIALRRAAAGDLGLFFLHSDGSGTLYDDALHQLDLFLEDLTKLGTAPPEALLYARSYAERIDLSTSPLGVIARGVDTLAADVQAQAEGAIMRLNLLRGLFVGVMVCIVLALGVFLILPALRDLSLSLGRERSLRVEMESMARSDSLTGLLNRSGLEEVVRHAAPGSDFAFAVVDLNNFKPVNDTFGHAAGDMVLVEVAHRLRGLDFEATIARLGGDEFAVLANGLVTPESRRAWGERLLTAFEAPISVDERAFQIGATLGVAHSSDFAGDFDAVISAADAAMYDLKGNGKTCVGHYAPHIAARVPNLDRKAEIEAAIITQDVQPDYQPKFRLSDYRLVGFEALARWHHPDKGKLYPGAFLEDVDRYRLQFDLTKSMALQVLTQLRKWRAEGFDPPPVAMNISPELLALDEAVAELLSIFAGFEDVCHSVVLELTEEVFVGRIVDAVRESLGKFTAKGIRIAIDDFGCGYASFRHLKEFPMHELKIDKSFVGDIGETGTAEVLLSAFMSIAKGLGVDVVAEGVETEAQRALLMKLGCTMGQGFLFSPGLSVSDATVLLASPTSENWRIRA